jgi:FkbM family methyltransferase
MRGIWRAGTSKPEKTAAGFWLAGNSGMASGQFEAHEQRVMRQLIEESDVFVDVGANVGLYTCMAAARGKETLAIEPLGENLQLLYQNLLRNGLAQVEVFPVAVSDKPGIVSLYGGGTGASLIAGWATGSASYREYISTSTLDTLLRGRFPGRQLLIKMDIEGAEYNALKGAVDTLSRLPMPTWMIEISLTAHHPGGINTAFGETFEVFLSRGYQGYVIGERVVPIGAEDVMRWTDAPDARAGGDNFIFTDRSGEVAARLEKT